MQIPVFVSCPTRLNDAQNTARECILAELSRLHLEPRALGRSDYPTELPLHEVYLLAKHCAGGLILGFEQFLADAGITKRGTDEEKRTDRSRPFPSSWNHLEAGILFAIGLPLLVFREEGIDGGVFDRGVTDVFVHKMPVPPLAPDQQDALTDVFLKWQTSVRNAYYAPSRTRLAQ